MNQYNLGKYSLVVRTKDPTLASRCKKHNLEFTATGDKGGYDIYFIIGESDELESLVKEMEENN